jgi:hypothetical protein
MIGCFIIQAQHKLSLYSGVTISKLQSYGNSAVANGAIHSDLYGGPPLSAPYLSLEYEHDYKTFRFSTG